MRKLKFLCVSALAALSLIGPAVSYADPSQEEVLEDMSSLSIREIHKFAHFAAIALQETDYQTIGEKLKKVKAISTRTFFEKYSPNFKPGSDTYKKIMEQHIRVQVTNVGELYMTARPKHYEYLIPVSTVSIINRARSKRDRFVSLTVVKTSKGIRLSNYSVFNIAN